MSGTMPASYASTVVEAPADEVWAVLRDFGELGAWFPVVAMSEIEAGRASDQVGAIRRLVLPDGSVFRERLVALSDADRTLTYDFEEVPIEVSAYRSTVRVAPVTDRGASFVEWSASFACAPEAADEWSRFFAEDIYGAAFAALGEHLRAAQAV